MTVAMPQDKSEVLIRVTSRGYIVAQTMNLKLTAPNAQNGEKIVHVIPDVLTEFLLPDIDALLDWLANHLAVPARHDPKKTTNSIGPH